MRYRSVNTPEQLSQDAARFAEFLGGPKWLKALFDLGKSLNHKGYVTTLDDSQYSLERELLQFEKLRIEKAGILKGMPAPLHDATDFIIGVGQTIPHLSPTAKDRLKQTILGMLKSGGLRSVRHEFRIAGMISRHGFDVSFSDLEGSSGGYDFLARRGDLEYEVEGKSITPYLGYPIDPEDAEKLFLELKKNSSKFDARERIPIINITLKGRLEVNAQRMNEVVDVCARVAKMGTKEDVNDYATISYFGSVPSAHIDELNAAVRVDRSRSYAFIYLSTDEPKMVLRVNSARASKFPTKLLRLLSETAKDQFSANRPGIIWIDLDLVTTDQFDALVSNSNGGASFFDLVAMAVLLSPKRSHISQLIFSGGRHLMRKGDHARSASREVIYNSPLCRFDVPPLFEGGRSLRQVEHGMEERAKSALRAAKMYFTIESGPREEARILEDQFIKWALSDSTSEGRIDVGVRLLRMALAASNGGQFKQACDHYDELLRILPEDKNEGEWDLFATAHYNRANMLSEMGQHEEAIAAYTKISDEISALKLAPVAEKWAKAMFNSARIYETRLQKFEMAADCYQSIINLAAESVDLLPRDVVAQSYVNLGLIAESADQALVYFNEVITKHFLSNDRALREQVQKALLNKMYCLIGLERNDAALIVADQILAYSDPPNKEINIVARSQKVLILEAMGSFEMMLQVEGVEEGLKPLIGAEAKDRAIRALLSKAKHLTSMSRIDDAIEIYRAIEDALILEVDGTVLDYLAFAYAAWIEMSMESRCEEEALVLCDSLIGLYEKLPHASAIYYTSWALFLKSHMLAERGDSAGAAAIAAEILVKFGPESKTPSEEVYFRAIDARAAHLNDLKEFGAVLPLCDQYLERSNQPDAPTTQVGLARTLVCKGNALLRSNRPSEAKALLEGFVKQFASFEDSAIIDLVEYATALITELSEKSTDQA